MTLIVKARQSTFIAVPDGMHLARCYRFVDLGTQRFENQGQFTELPKVRLLFEVHGEDEFGKKLVTNKGEPMTISRTYTLMLDGNAKLKKDLETWRGRAFTQVELDGFDLTNVLDKWAMISVVSSAKDGRTYTNINAVMPVPAAIKQAGLPPPHNKTSMFVIANPDMELFNTFSENLQNVIMRSPEWQSRHGAKSVSTTPVNPYHNTSPVEPPKYEIQEDDLPF